MRTELEATSNTVPATAHRPLLELNNLKVYFGGGRSILGAKAPTVRAVNGISLRLEKGKVLGIIGESGSGKTTLVRSIVGLSPITSGQVLFKGRSIGDLSARDLRPFRRHIQMVFQDPHASLNPTMTIGDAVGHPLVIHGLAKGQELEQRVVAALEKVGLAPAHRFIDKYPSDLSGGQKQRAVIARAIITGPDLVIADEPISMLDMSVRAKILSLLTDLKERLELTYIYVTHDLASARFFCDEVAIMYMGEIVEQGAVDTVFASPAHPYTKALIAAMPNISGGGEKKTIKGEVADAAMPPSGCTFHTRCPAAFAPCGWEAKDLRGLVEEWSLDNPDDAVIGEFSQARDDPNGIFVPIVGDPFEARKHMNRLRQGTATHRFWKGLVEIEVQQLGLHLSMTKPLVPRPVNALGRQVSCHLFDQQFVQSEEQGKATQQ